MKKLFLLLMLLQTLTLFTTEVKKDSTSDLYENEKITFETKKYFDEMYPQDAKEFFIYQGKNRITEDQLITLTQDPVLIKNRLYEKRTKIAGFSTAIALGIASGCFATSFIIFVAIQTNYHNIPSMQDTKGWLNYFNTHYTSIYIPGISLFFITAISGFAMLIDLVVTYSMIQKYKMNEKTMRSAIEKYNQSLRQKYGIRPDLTVMSDMLNFEIKINL